MAPAGGLMLGMSRTVVGDAAREYEQLRVEVRAGRVAYVARPSGQAEASFAATLLSDSAAVFANPEHDFPQRIGYRRVREDSLIAWIEGTERGRSRRIEFPMAKASCGR